MKKLNKKGFSLVELIIVIAIMAVLIGVLAPTYLGQVKKSKKATDLQNAQEIAVAIAVQAAENEAAGRTVVSEANWASLPSGVTSPAVQLDGAYSFVYKYAGTSGADVFVGVQKTVSGTTTTYQLYPTVSAGGGWGADE